MVVVGEHSRAAVTTDLRNANLRLLSDTTLTVSNVESKKKMPEASRYTYTRMRNVSCLPFVCFHFVENYGPLLTARSPFAFL